MELRYKVELLRISRAEKSDRQGDLSRSTGSVGSLLLTCAVTSLLLSVVLSFDFSSAAYAESSGTYVEGSDLESSSGRLAGGAFGNDLRSRELEGYRFGFVRTYTRGAHSAPPGYPVAVRSGVAGRKIAALTPQQRASYRRTQLILSQLGELRPYDAFRTDDRSEGGSDVPEGTPSGVARAHYEGSRFGNLRPAAEPDRRRILDSASEGYFSRDSYAGELIERFAEMMNPDPFGYRGTGVRTRIATLNQSGPKQEEHSTLVGLFDAVDRFDSGDYAGGINQLSYELVEGTYAALSAAAALVFPVTPAHAEYRTEDLTPQEVRSRLEEFEHSYQRDGLARF